MRRNASTPPLWLNQSAAPNRDLSRGLLYADGKGLVFVSDQAPSVHARREDGSIVGRCKPAVTQPHGFTGDRDGTLYVIETRIEVPVSRLVPVA